MDAVQMGWVATALTDRLSAAYHRPEAPGGWRRWSGGQLNCGGHCNPMHLRTRNVFFGKTISAGLRVMQLAVTRAAAPGSACRSLLV